MVTWRYLCRKLHCLASNVGEKEASTTGKPCALSRSCLEGKVVEKSDGFDLHTAGGSLNTACYYALLKHFGRRNHSQI